MQSDEPRVDWDAFLTSLRQHPSAAFYSDEARDQMLLLHLVCALNPPVDLVEQVYGMNPIAVYHQSTQGGLTPVMIACGRNARPNVIRLLCSKDKKALTRKDSSGYTAIHWACRENVSHKLVKTILLVDPLQSTRTVDRADGIQQQAGGISPVEILYQNRSSTGTTWTTNQWSKFTYLLWARHYGSIDARSQHNFSTLHAALACKCPSDVIDEVIKLYGASGAGVRDVYRNLPLHYAVQSATVSRAHIQGLLVHFSQAAALNNAGGRLALHEALIYGKRWRDGIDLIYRCNKAAAAIDDGCTLLPPALMAASLNSDVETIFGLLRAYPQVLTK